MKDLEFGLTMTVLGMGGTLFILYLIGLAVDGMKKALGRREKREETRA